ncbi:hypothetical protein Taro_052346, partial [Colocasia esculenta]|nr:hypothetical protein [Colocasia esculenta]
MMDILLTFSWTRVFLVVTDEASGRSIPFVFLDRVKGDFVQRYGASIDAGGCHPLADEDEDEDDDLFEDIFSIAYNLDREFGYLTKNLKFLRPRLKEHMNYCVSHPEEMSKLSKLKAQITEVKGIMMDNIEKVDLKWVVAPCMAMSPLRCNCILRAKL